MDGAVIRFSWQSVDLSLSFSRVAARRCHRAQYTCIEAIQNCTIVYTVLYRVECLYAARVARLCDAADMKGRDGWVEAVVQHTAYIAAPDRNAVGCGHRHVAPFFRPTDSSSNSTRHVLNRTMGIIAKIITMTA